MEIKRFFNHILKSTINILNHRILFYGIIINQRDLKMHPKSNPEEFENNQSFMVKSVKSKLKCLVTKEVSNYTIRQKIGQGSYAKVYKAIHKPTGEIVAAKILTKSKMTDQEIEKTHYEVQVHKKLFHTNIARIYEYCQDDDKLYIFMELCQNGELFNYINRNGPLSQKFAAKVFKEILSALKYLKTQRLFHRDIKCQNIMFDHNWNAKLVDFGFVTKQEDGCFSRTFCGSPSYTAPELAKKQKYHSQMIDIWCLGVTLYAMLAGQLPFDGQAMRDTKRNIMEIKYQLKNFFSDDVKLIFNKIFVEDTSRVTIEELQEMEFSKKGYPIHPNFINTDVEQIVVDSHILDLVTSQFNVNSYEIIESVTRFKLDQNYSLYYLTIQKEILRGHKVKSDISSSDFQKRKKRSTTLKLIKVREDSQKRSSRSKLHDLQTPDLKGKKDIFRIRPSQPSVDVQNARLRKRDQSPESPKRILDLVSAYRRRL